MSRREAAATGDRPPGPNDHACYLLHGLAGASTAVLRVELRCNGGTCPSGGGSYQIAAGLVNTGTTWTATNWFTLSDAPHSLELDWQRGTSGSLTLWIDGTQQGQVTGVNNSTRVIDRVRLGPVNGIDTATRGAYFLDDFVSRRFNYIGALLSGGITHLARLLAPATPSGTRTPTATPTALREALPPAVYKPAGKLAGLASPLPQALASNGE